MSAYYNEIKPFAAQWLRNLIARDLIAPGEVDERSIVDVQPDDLQGFDQCHFFAGIGGWSYALRLAGWPDDRPIWTGSCPCQPFSAAGKQGGSEDERHLWPAFFRLIRECRPATVFGEQVAGAAGLAWLDHVHADLEESSYAVAAADLPACSVGAPHRRQRLWWVADAQGIDWEVPVRERRPEQEMAEPGGRGRVGSGLLGNSNGEQTDAAISGQPLSGPASIDRPWADLEWLPCSDGKARPTESTIQCFLDGLSDSLGYSRDGDRYVLSPLIQGAKNRVGRLRAYGNAIVPALAAEFIKAYIDVVEAH